MILPKILYSSHLSEENSLFLLKNTNIHSPILFTHSVLLGFQGQFPFFNFTAQKQHCCAPGGFFKIMDHFYAAENKKTVQLRELKQWGV